MHGCTKCAVMLILNTSNRGELSIHGCAQCAVILILDTSNRGEPSLTASLTTTSNFSMSPHNIISLSVERQSSIRALTYYPNPRSLEIFFFSSLVFNSSIVNTVSLDCFPYYQCPSPIKRTYLRLQCYKTNDLTLIHGDPL
jgi:hypothetical protein